MSFLRTLGLPLLALALLAGPASAQTKPSTKKKPMRHTTTQLPARKMATKRLPDGRKANGSGNNVYAAPGQPVNVLDNGKNTPPYDGPAAGHGTPASGTVMPKQ